MKFYVEAIVSHIKNYDTCIFREIAVGDNKKACIKKVLENLSDYHRQGSYLDDEYASIEVYSAKLEDGVYEKDTLIKNVTVEPLENYIIFLETVN